VNLSEKKARLETAIRSFSEHVDEDASVRIAGLNSVKGFIDGEIARIEADVQARIEAAFPAEA
jgi:hypothetical protein